MLKARASKSNVLRFDPRRPVMLFSAGSSLRFLSMNLALTLDPAEALELGAESIRVRVLSDSYKNPTTLDDVTVASDVLENIKGINAETSDSYRDFTETKVISQSEISITSILSTFSEDLALEYIEGSQGGTLENLMPFVKVATIEASTPKRQRKSPIAEVLETNTDFTYDNLDALFNLAELPKSFSANVGSLRQFALMSPEYGKTISGLGLYPFPIPVDYDLYRDPLSCTAIDTEQSRGLSQLTDLDFFYVQETVFHIGETLESRRDLPGSPTEFDVLTPIQTPPNTSVLSTPYMQCIAYDETLSGRVFTSNKQLKRLPFSHLETIFASEAIPVIPRNVVVELSVMNRLGVILSKLTRQVNTRQLLKNTMKPMVAPTVVAAQLNGEADGATTADITITQNDPMANKVVVLKKEGPSARQELVGVFPLPSGESLDLSILEGEPGVYTIIRVVSVIDEKVSTNAFVDVTLQSLIDDLLATPDATPPIVNPTVTTGIDAGSSYSENDDGTFDVTITTTVFSDGEGTIEDASSAYDFITIRKLSPLDGDRASGIPGEDGGFYLIDQDGFEMVGPAGGSFVDKSTTPGRYEYVIDAMASGGSEFLSNVARTLVDIPIQADISDPIYKVRNLKTVDEETKISIELQFTVEPPETVVDPDYDTLSIDLGLPGMLPMGISLADYEPNVSQIDFPSDRFAVYLITAKIPKTDLQQIGSTTGRGGSGDISVGFSYDDIPSPDPAGFETLDIGIMGDVAR